MKKGETVELTLDSAAYEGLAVGRLEGFVVFVRDAVPGDRVRARILRRKKNYAEAALEAVLQPSPRRADPRCRHFGVCGGCRWQNAEYALQLEFKRQQVEDLMRRIGGFPEATARPVLESPSSYFYRNKMEFTFGASRWLTEEEISSGAEVDRSFALGLHVPRRFDRILDLQECHLQSPLSARIVNWMRDFARDKGWSPYDVRSHQGYLRNLTIRLGRATGQTLVNLVTSRDDPERMRELSEAMLQEFPEITTLVNSVNEGRSPVAAGLERVYHGDGFIRERLGGLTFRVAPTTFFQPNSEQAERLYGVAQDFADLTGGEILFDIYSGIGCIGLFLAGLAQTVVGVEQQEEAVAEARRNAEANGVANAFFYASDAERALDQELLERHGSPDVVVADPPRVGLSRALCEAILRVRPGRVVYVSCNPATQARDLQLLGSAYSISALQPVDMFPQTHHIENVALLVRR